MQGDAASLPLRAGTVDLLVDRGCFHYLGAGGRERYAGEAERVLRAGGRLILRMCTTSAGVPNGLDETTVQQVFDRWLIVAMERVQLVSDTRTMPAVTAVLERPAG